MYSKLLTTFLGAFVAVSCTAALEETVYSTLTDDTAFTSAENAQAAVNSLYTPLHSLYREPMFYLNDVNVDTGYKGGSPFEVLNDQGIYNDNRTQTAWNLLYQVACRANIAIDKIPPMEARLFSGISMKQLMGEAYFMRAWAYYTLTDLFFQVPLVTDSNIDPVSREPLSPIATIEKQIESDLLMAADYLPRHYRDHADAGRPTYGAAMGYLCRLYMRQAGRARVAGKADDASGAWYDALMAVNKVLELEGTEYSLQPTVWEVFDPSSDESLYNNELIFAVRASDKTLASGSWDLGLQFTPWAFDMGWSNILQPLELTWQFHPDDERLTVLQVWEYPDVYHPEKTYYRAPLSVDKTGTIPSDRWVDGINYTEMYELESTFTQKYKYLYTKQYNYNTPNNLPLLRLSDMILCKAEILNEMYGPTAEALELLNRIRTRAFQSESHNLRSADVPTREAFRSALCDERLYELNMECMRRSDLVRMGLWKSRMQKYLTTIQERFRSKALNEGREEGYYSDQWAAYPLPESLTDGDIRMYAPIPYREVTINPALALAREAIEADPTPSYQPDGPAEPAYSKRWDFDSFSGWRWETQGDTPQGSGWVQDGLLMFTTRAKTQDRTKAATQSRVYGPGRYSWYLEVPTVEEGDQVSLGAFLYRDDTHELDFEIGYGTETSRVKCGARSGDMVACLTSQANPFVSNYTPIAPGWHTVTLDLEDVDGKYLCRWLIDGAEKQSRQLQFGPETKFYIYCSLENLSFMGSHLPVKDYTVKFDYVTYTEY